jgi:catechol 2,3-dioxygenase-like lactoylglutathione lyase family enzyme
MLLNLSHIGQIGLAVGDVDRAERFYETVIGLRKLYRFVDLTFFDCAGCGSCSKRRATDRNLGKTASSTSAALTSR